MNGSAPEARLPLSLIPMDDDVLTRTRGSCGGVGVEQVMVCAGGEGRGACDSPRLSGSGQSVFLAQLDTVPEVAEQGGLRVPATVVLEAPSSR